MYDFSNYKYMKNDLEYLYFYVQAILEKQQKKCFLNLYPVQIFIQFVYIDNFLDQISA